MPRSTDLTGMVAQVSALVRYGLHDIVAVINSLLTRWY